MSDRWPTGKQYQTIGEAGRSHGFNAICGPPLARREQRITSQRPGIVLQKMVRFLWWIGAHD
jgi:hypothetical protein